jgi:hypothetical protein
MASLAQKTRAEKVAREFLETNGFDQPDRVEYGEECIRLLFEEPRVVLVIDLDEPGDAEPSIEADDM